MKNIWLPALLIVWTLPTFAADERIYQGYVEGEYIRLGLPEGGTLDMLAVRRGDKVDAGQLLFRLDAAREKTVVADREAALAEAQSRLADLTKGRRPSEIRAIKARLTQARASHDLAIVEFKRQQELAKTGVAALGKLDQARAAYDFTAAKIVELEAELTTARLPARDDLVQAARETVKRAASVLDEARWQLGQRAATAPKSARVFDVFYRTGEFIPKGQPVVSLLPPGHIKVRFFVPENVVANVQPGQTVTIDCDSCRATLTARVGYISQTAEFTPPVIYSEGVREKLVFLIEAWPDENAPLLHPGQPVDVTLTP